ncbi:MAG: hypothetical protein KM312_02440 [Hydrogenibacillus schlegelii]|uniref:Band 7 domain-containing protein n=1 Tax=Hydrogenibacillus schlegelii TaxID=1484 RepID=A0A947GGU5_HYDSH|nr:hypothetical protein [Hydrogenibacillus schlegelii]
MQDVFGGLGDPLVWFVLAFGLFIVEALTVTFVLVWVGLGALAAGIVTLFRPGTAVALAVFVLVSTALWWGTRPFSERMRRRSRSLASGVFALVGRRGWTLSALDATVRGEVKIDGEIWSARSESGPIAAGRPVRVVAVEGVTLIVEPDRAADRRRTGRKRRGDRRRQGAMQIRLCRMAVRIRRRRSARPEAPVEGAGSETAAAGGPRAEKCPNERGGAMFTTLFNVVLFLIAVYLVVLLIRSVRIVRQAEVCVVERLGKFHRVLDSGIHLIIPIIDRVAAVKDLREHVVEFPPQSMITRDNVSIQIDSVVYYQITDPIRNQYEIANPIAAIENLTATTLRNLIGELDLDQTLTSRDTVNAKLRAVLDEATDKWGIKINRVEIKNIVPPKEIQDAMERQMRAERIRREAVLMAQGEKESNILKAEGLKQAKILEAEAEREAAIRRAEGEKQSQILRAEGEAQAILTLAEAQARGQRMIFEAIKQAAPTKEVVQIRSLEALEKVAEGQATKLIVPSDVASLLGVVAGAKEVLDR